MASTQSAKRIRVHLQTGDAGFVYATSPDVRGLFVAGRSEAKALDAVPGVIVDLNSASGVSVIALPLEGADGREFVAFPREPFSETSA